MYSYFVFSLLFVCLLFHKVVLFLVINNVIMCHTTPPITWSQTSTMSNKATKFTPPEHPHQNQRRKLYFPNWFNRESNPGPSHLVSTVLTVESQRLSNWYVILYIMVYLVPESSAFNYTFKINIFFSNKFNLCLAALI